MGNANAYLIIIKVDLVFVKGVLEKLMVLNVEETRIEF